MVTTQVHGSKVHGSRLESDEACPCEGRELNGEQFRRTSAIVRGFISYLKKYEERKSLNHEP